MQTLLSSMAAEIGVEWKFCQICRGFCFWEAFVKSLGGRANQRSGDHQKLDWTLIVRPFAFEELRFWFIHRPQISFLHPSKIMGWSCQRVGWEYLSAIIRGGAHFCQRWVKNECRSMCRGGAKASFFRCRQSHLTSVLRCNFTAMQTDQLRTKAQQTLSSNNLLGL